MSPVRGIKVQKLKIAVVGLGKMGLSHFAMVNAHPAVEAVGCDGSAFLVDALEKNIETPMYRDFGKMLEAEPLDGVVIATPSRHHADLAAQALERGVHVFCEKPLCLDWKDSQRLTELAAGKGLIAQAGYHYRFVGAFQEMKRLLDAKAAGTITHVLAEAYGPVVLRPKRATWRTQQSEGGGCLYDYAAHPLNLLNWFFGVPDRVSGSVLGHVFSEATDDQVFSTLQWNDGPTAQLSVNWSDESHRKMSTKISVIGTNGRITADRQECQAYLRAPVGGLADYGTGWTVKYTTELTEDRWFYLRGEEYSAQIDEFVKAIQASRSEAIENTFASATQTDQTMAMILENAASGTAVGDPPAKRRVAAPQRKRLFGWA